MVKCDKMTYCSFALGARHVLYIESSLFLQITFLWLNCDRNCCNSAYQWEVKVKLAQKDLSKAVGYNRYLTEPSDV